MVLGARAGDFEDAVADLVAAETSDLIAPLSGQDQELEDATIVIVTQGKPDGGKLLILQDAVARRGASILVQVRDGGGLNQALATAQAKRDEMAELARSAATGP